MSDFEPFSCVNGQADSAVSVLDRGLAYGDGLFETMRLEQGVLPFWSLHRQRLQDGCERLQIPLDAELLEAYLSSFLGRAREQQVGKAVIKLTVSRGQAGRGYQPSLKVEPTVVLSAFPFVSHPPDFFRKGVQVYLCEHRLPHSEGLAGLKHLNKLDHVLAAMEWRESGCQEALLFDLNNVLVEASSRNVFLVKDGALQTPSLHMAGVSGILRERIMADYAKRLGRIVEESTLSQDSLLAADEIFLCNSVFGVWPVQSLKSKGLGRIAVPRGDLGSQIHQLYEDDIHARVQEHVA